MVEVSPLDDFLASKIKNRCLDLLSKEQDKEYFLVFSGLLETLRFEYNKGFMSEDENRVISYDLDQLESKIYNSIFIKLFEDNNAREKKVKDGINALTYNHEGEELRLIPYLVDNKTENINNIGNRGFAGKLRDDQELRSDNTCIIIFDINPIETLQTASDGNILKEIFSKDKLKGDLRDENSPKWYNELVKTFFNDNFLHSLNIIERLNKLYEIKNSGYKKSLNNYIKEYRLPLFSIKNEKESENDIIKDNYKLYCKVNSEMIEPVTMNFKKKVLDKLNFASLPEEIDENLIEEILRNESLHLSPLYEIEEINYSVAKNLFENKGPSKVKGIEVEPNNKIYEEIKSNKNKVEGFINKGNLRSLKVKLKGEINDQDKFFVHYYFNNQKKDQVKTKKIISGKCEIELDDINKFQTLNIVVNQNKKKITKALIKGKFILQEEASEIIIPEIEGKVELEEGELYPTLVMKNAEEIKNISCTVVGELGSRSKENCKLTRDEELEDDKIKYNLLYNGKEITKVIIREEEDEPSSYKHLLSFIAEKGIETITDIKFKSDEYTTFTYKNKLYNCEVDEKFNELLKRYDLSSLNELYRLLLNNPNEYYLVINEGFKECISSQADDVLKMRSEVLKSFKSIYDRREIDLKEALDELHYKINSYLKLFKKKVREIPELVKVDIIEIGDKRVLSPFAPINLSFYLLCWHNIYDGANIELLKNADNSEVFKYIQGEDSWYVAQSSPAFLWLYYTPESAVNSFGVEKYLSSVIKNKIKHLSDIYPYLFSTNNQTIHIGFLNPGDSRFILEGIESYLKHFKSKRGNLDEIPRFHISLIYDECKRDNYCTLDDLFERGANTFVEEFFINKISYSKTNFKDIDMNKSHFYHLFFIKDLFEVDNNSVNMFNQEEKYLNTYFANGVNCYPLTKSEYKANHVTYTAYSNYKSSLENKDKSIFANLLEVTNAFYPQAFIANIATNNHRLRTVNVTPENIPDNLINQSFMVTFLDREIDIDIFNSEKMKKVERPFLVDYSNYSSVKKGGNEDVKFLTITNQKKPFVELFKHVLKEYNAIEDLEGALEGLFNDLNLLNGFWVLDLLGNSNNLNKIKGILGTLAAFRVLKKSLQEDEDNWHIIIGIEELMGVVPGYSKHIAMRFDDEAENNRYCDDLAVISFPKSLNNNIDSSVQIRLVEVKNSKTLGYICKGFEQLEQTERRLEKYFITEDDKLNSFRNKEIVNWIVYNLNKYKVFDNGGRFLNDNLDSEFSKSLKLLVDGLNHGKINIEIEEGILINVNSTNEVLDGVELRATRDYLLLSEEDFIEIVNDETDIRFDKLLVMFKGDKNSQSNKNAKSNKNNQEIESNLKTKYKDINSETEFKELDGGELVLDSKSNYIDKNFKTFIGRKSTASQELVFYDPKRQGDNLSNMNVMITGSPGRGKTQLLKSMILQQRKQGVNLLIFDFKNDFGDEEFLKQSDLEHISLEFEGLPYNPLIPPCKKSKGKSYLNGASHSIAISGVLKSVYGLGTQQEATLKEIIRDVYNKYGINAYGGSMEYNNSLKFPVLNEVAATLREENKKAYARLDTIFSYGMFKEEFRDVSLADLLDGSYVFNLSSIANDEVKNAIAKILVVSAHQYLNTLPHSQNINNIFVFDEAHRFLDEPKLTSLVRECRAYGLAVWLSSQFPDDYPSEISGALETKIIHGNGTDEKRVKTIKKLTGFEGRTDIIKDLGLFEAIFVNKHYSQALINNLTYPHALILIEVFKNKSMREDSKVPGVQSVRQKELLSHLLGMGLLELGNKGYTLTDDGKMIAQYFYEN
ncbi:type IV secretion system DNA-binding domain-containing protein [Halonatronum saccharophilum]|uniref:type IV secretion system DNA-binding domain-containing protein n=1 Tax=Halonatronum saccharophilum TaxID=150060 RepID=UPI0004816128|nr:type IV secretion system DNA-binding domain-containing protein [Halonatronum saccharophilum]